MGILLRSGRLNKRNCRMPYFTKIRITLSFSSVSDSCTNLPTLSLIC